MNKKKGKKIIALLSAILMVVSIMPITSFSGIFMQTASAGAVTNTVDATNSVYTLDTTADLTAVAKGAKADGDEEKAGTNDYFTIIYSANSKVDNSSKEFEDGYSATQRLNFGGKVTTAQNAVKFTTNSAATVKVWWVEGGDDNRQMTILNASGDQVAITSETLAKNETCISTFSLTDAGTYYLGGATKNNYIFKIEVVESNGSTEKEPRAAWSEVAAPEITGVTVNESSIDVTVKMEIGYDGADSITVTMTNANGEAATKKSSKEGSEVTLNFVTTASGTYIFSVVASRDGEEDKAGEKSINVSYTLPLSAPNVNARTADSSSIEVYWDAVDEAESYKVEYKKAGESDFSVLVESTTSLSATTPALTVGDSYIFRVTAIRGTDTKTSSEVTQVVADHEQYAWKFSAFGQGVSVDSDNLSDKTKSNGGYSGDVNSTGSVNVWAINGKGKLVPASTDGLSFYYTAIPASKNFTLTATATVNSWTYSNGQEGFGLMAADSVGVNGNSSVFWNNSYMASVTKVEYYSNVDEETGEASVSTTSGNKISMKLGIGSQEKVGVTAENIDSFKNNDTSVINSVFSSTMTTLETSKLGSEAGTYNLIANATNTDETFTATTVENPLTTVTLTIQKNNTGYFVSYTDAEGNVTTKKYYDTEALEQIDADNVYVGLFASRNCDVTFSDITLTTINPEDDAPAEARPVDYTDVTLNITSASTASTADYTLTGMSNVNGHVVVTDGSNVVAEADVTADEVFSFDTTLKVGSNKFVVTLTPDADFKFGDYELPTSYDPVETSKTVTYANFTGDVIYVSAEETAAVDAAKAEGTYSQKAQINAGKGTKSNPIDIYSAVAFAKAGQKILLLDGDYSVKNNILIPFGIDGTSEKPIYLMPESTDTRIVLDCEGTLGEGLTICGNYWYIQNIDVKNSANGKDGIHVCGSYNVLDSVNTYDNGNTGIQISRYSSTQAKEDWPAYNTIKNCTSYNNADAGYEDADGFAAKLTIGKGNVFIGCIAYNNADDGWDLFAKVETGNIPTVVIMNCVAYGNGFLSDGTNAGNGNGFKMGGSSLSGGHVLLNCVAYDNKAKGIDSNSCPDNVVISCTSYNNGNYNVALYTNDAANTDYTAYGIISYRNKYTDVTDSLKAKGNQDKTKLYQSTDYYWNAASGDAKDASKYLTDSSFVSVDTKAVAVETVSALADTETVSLLADVEAIKYTSYAVTRNADGTVNMNGLMMLTSETSKALGTGVGATDLSAAPQLTDESKAILVAALGEDEVTRISAISLTSPILSRDGSQGTLTKDLNSMGLMLALLLASIAAAAGVAVFTGKKRGMAR